ncbi:MAG: ABC transporter ATP-binding protein [Chthoniobacterales bacterium]
MLEIDGISKVFRGRQALHPLTLEITKGEIFGLLGHNGAGKSTTFGITLGHVRSDTGEVRVAGHSVQKDRARALHRVGAIFETPAFHGYLSGWRNLEMLVMLTAKPDPVRMRAMVELVGLTKRINDPVSVYSHGMRQRLALAQALLPNPEFIILDEPSEGLDPEGIQEMRNLILRLRDEHGLTVLLSSHLLSEVEQICSRVAILNQGRMVYCGSWKDSPSPQARWILEVDDWTRATPVLAALGCTVVRDGEIDAPSTGDISDVVRALVHAQVRVHRVEPVKWSLENFYLEHIRE